MTINVAVIGAGIVGLPTAYKVLQDVSNVKVTVFYEECSPNTTGDVSAGFIFPYLCHGSSVSKWMKLTMDHFTSLFQDPNAYEIGVQPMSGYADDKAFHEPFVQDLLPFCQPCTKKESVVLSKKGDWWKISTWLCDCSKYLPWLTNQIKNLGGKFKNRRINSFEELHNFDVIINCTGISAKYLTADEKLEPFRGQVMVVKAPWLKHIIIKPPAYILPRLNDVVLGGTAQKGNFSTKIDPVDSKMIWQECCKLNPSVKYSEVIEERVGLRPSRDPIRLEMEEKWLNGKKVPILHNYGHGGAGVTLHWGCAIEASEILQQHLKNSKGMSKL